MSNEPNCSQSEIVLYQTEDGRTRLEVQLEHKSARLTQAQMAELFRRPSGDQPTTSCLFVGREAICAIALP